MGRGQGAGEMRDGYGLFFERRVQEVPNPWDIWIWNSTPAGFDSIGTPTKENKPPRRYISRLHQPISKRT
jgi:hypothetical protein